MQGEVGVAIHHGAVLRVLWLLIGYSDVFIQMVRPIRPSVTNTHCAVHISGLTGTTVVHAKDPPNTGGFEPCWYDQQGTTHGNILSLIWNRRTSVSHYSLIAKGQLSCIHIHEQRKYQRGRLNFDLNIINGKLIRDLKYTRHQRNGKPWASRKVQMTGLSWCMDTCKSIHGQPVTLIWYHQLFYIPYTSELWVPIIIFIYIIIANDISIVFMSIQQSCAVKSEKIWPCPSPLYASIACAQAHFTDTRTT